MVRRRDLARSSPATPRRVREWVQPARNAERRGPRAPAFGDGGRRPGPRRARDGGRHARTVRRCRRRRRPRARRSRRSPRSSNAASRRSASSRRSSSTSRTRSGPFCREVVERVDALFAELGRGPVDLDRRRAVSAGRITTLSEGSSPGVLSRWTRPLGITRKSPAPAWTALPTALTELDRHGTRDHVDDRVVAAVMVPAAHEAGLGRREPGPQAGLGERLPPVDLGRALDLDQLAPDRSSRPLAPRPRDRLLR